jgi:hypothetical protein
MTGTVLINIFAGVPNPVWQLESADADKFGHLILSYPSLPTPLDHAEFTRDTIDVLGRPRSGFRGFELTLQDDSGRSALYQTFNRLVFETETEKLLQDTADVALEKQLYLTAPADVMKRLDGLTYEALTAPGDETLIDGLQGPDVHLECDSSPTYIGNGDPMNAKNPLHGINNCYNYATFAANKSVSSGAVPGVKDKLLSDLNEVTLKAALIHDKLEFVGMKLPDACPNDGDAHYVVVVLRHVPSSTAVKDFHCIRLDQSGKWSHKDGKGPVTNVDNAGKEMTDLTKAKFSFTPKLMGVYRARYSKRSLVD